jgi:drug/metabolite transporter (DMT)-like permease
MHISPYILLALTSLFWSLNFIIGKILSSLIPPTTINFLRWLLPFLILLPLSWKEIKTHKDQFIAKWPLLLFLGGTGYCINSISVYEAVRYTTTINTSFINAFNPVLIAMTGYLLYHERGTRVQTVGFILSLAGVLCIIFKGDLGQIIALKVNVGDLFMLGSISLFSIHTVLYKQKAPDFPEKAMFTLMMLGGLLITLPMALAENLFIHWSWISQLQTVHIVGILCLNIFPSLLAYQFWNSALKKVSANQVAIFLYLIPVYTTVISILFLDEKLKWFQILGGLLIFVGVLLVTNDGPSDKTSKAARSSL